MIHLKIPLGAGALRRIFWGQGLLEIGEFTMISTSPGPAAMSFSADALYKMSEVELLAAYAEARRQFVEKKFARDTQRARLAWIRAKMFTSSSGGVRAQHGDRRLRGDRPQGPGSARDDARARSG